MTLNIRAAIKDRNQEKRIHAPPLRNSHTFITKKADLARATIPYFVI